MSFEPLSVCEECAAGTYRCYHTHIEDYDHESFRVRYYKCSACGHRPEGNKQVIPARFAPKRINMTKFNAKSSKQ